MSVTFDITIVAVIFTTFFFVSPFEAAVKIYQAKDAGDFSATPCILTAACALSQVYYCLVCLLRDHDGQALWLNFAVNVFGLIVNEVLLFFHYAYNRNRKKIILQNAVMLLLLGGFFVFLEEVARDWSPALQWWKAQATYLNVCSIVAVIINISMYAAPLTVMGMVIRTKSVQFMPLTPSIFICCSSTCWMTEGLLLGDVTFWLPNLIGLSMGLFQLALYVMYCGNKVKPAREASLIETPEETPA